MKGWVQRITSRSGREETKFRWEEGVGANRNRYQGAGDARIKVGGGHRTEIPNCDEYVEEYLEDYARRNRRTSLETQRCRLRRFRVDFKGRSLDVSRAELKEWIAGEGRWSEHPPVPPGQLQGVIALYNHAIDEGDVPLERSPARKLTRRYPGRAEEPPPTPEEFEALVAACSVLGEYGKTVRALLLFAAYTLMRPSELYALEWTDIDFPAMRIRKGKRAYRGELDAPKTGVKVIALPAPARDAIKGLPRNSKLVFPSKRGKQLAARTFGEYWARVTAAAGVDFHFYHATKHYGVHYMWTAMKLSPRAIAAQAGWKLETANRMLAIYGHGDVGALAEVDEAFYRSIGFPGREVGARLDGWHSRQRRVNS